MKTSLDDFGRILLPQVVQMQLGVKPGDELALQEDRGQWFLQPIMSAAEIHDNDLSWEELDYSSVPRRAAGRLTARVEQRGKLMPMAYELDDE
ncbi:MAG: AbrB/MazE/SpoVT family DNA-binding domain-containing protein [Patescibacteria group bacterium]|nr:AbrB/MazE/SpoVT family DNA-binding domain-containing protein [Patescibacteria group bacterium]